jgi:hypothetical protein
MAVQVGVLILFAKLVSYIERGNVRVEQVHINLWGSIAWGIGVAFSLIFHFNRYL